MSLYTDWQDTAYNKDGQPDKKYWDAFLPLEQKVYEKLLEEKTNAVSGVYSELAADFSLTNIQFTGFLDGIKGALKSPVDIENVSEDAEISFDFEFDVLFKKMVEYKAEHLYTLSQWNGILSKERQKELIVEQRKSKTIIKPEKIGRNDECSCGSGKKYKKCCGA